MERIPRIKTVAAMSNSVLVVHFDNGVAKTYDCAALFSEGPFRFLKTPAFFKAVHVDAGGRGISWNDAIDLSEYELWNNGAEIGNASSQ